MSQQVISIPRGDSAVIPFRLQLADGTFQDLSGYTVTLTAKVLLSDTSPALGPYTGVTRVAAATYSDITIPKGQLAAGVLQGCITAVGPSDQHSVAFILKVTEHA
jgi:hypothetical protein